MPDREDWDFLSGIPVSPDVNLMRDSTDGDNYLRLHSAVLWEFDVSRLLLDELLRQVPLLAGQQTGGSCCSLQAPPSHLPLAQGGEAGGLAGVELVHWPLRVAGLQRPPDVLEGGCVVAQPVEDEGSVGQQQGQEVTVAWLHLLWQETERFIVGF